MKAIITAADSAKYFFPLNFDAPKAAVKLFSKPLIEYSLELLKNNGFDEVVIILGYMAQSLSGYLSQREDDGLKISIFISENETCTAGDIKAAAQGFSEPFLLMGGDVFCDFALSELMNFHLAGNADITIACKSTDDPRRCAIIEFDESDKVKAFTEKPPFFYTVSDSMNTEIYVLSPGVMQAVDDGCRKDFTGELLPELLKQGKTAVSKKCGGYFRRITAPSDLLSCMFDVMDCKTKVRLPKISGAVYTPGQLACGDYSIIEPCYIGEGVKIGSGSVIGPYAVIENGCQVGENAKIVRSCMLGNSVLGGSSTLSGSILAPKSKVGPGCTVGEGAVVGPYAAVSSDCTVGNGITVAPETVLEKASRITRSVKYADTALCLNDSNRFSGSLTGGFDAVNAAVIGQALASCAFGSKIGIMTDSKPLSNAMAHCLKGAMMSHGATVWDFGEGFLCQLEFYMRFCSMSCGVFVSSRDSKVSITLCGENGLEMTNACCNELEERIRFRDFTPCSEENVREISDMSGVAMMYRREILRQSETELSDVSCRIKCPDAKIAALLEDCLYQLGCRNGDMITFKINASGNILSAFSRDCGWVSHDRLSAVILNFETQNKRDVAISFDAPYAFDDIILKNGGRVLRFFRCPTDGSDGVARELSRSSAFMRDALLMSVRLLYIICSTGKSLSRLVADIPDFYVSRRSVPLGFEPSKLKSRLPADRCSATREGFELKLDSGRVRLTPSRTGKSLGILAEAANYEISKELCSEVEKMIKKKE